MALMTWNDSFSVGVRAMDEQHKGLVKALNDLHDAMLSGEGRMVTGPLLQTLVKYTRQHFAAEEGMMGKTGYPQAGAHGVKHAKLTREVEDYVRRYESGEPAINVELMTFLRDWLTTHILKEDRSYGPWLNAHGMH